MSLKIPADLQVWIEARKRFKLSHAQVQMARELGMNPKKLGSLANKKQEPCKLPLPQFIEELYLKRFSRAVIAGRAGAGTRREEAAAQGVAC